jgi:hypothetical protein
MLTSASEGVGAVDDDSPARLSAWRSCASRSFRLNLDRKHSPHTMRIISPIKTPTKQDTNHAVQVEAKIMRDRASDTSSEDVNLSTCLLLLVCDGRVGEWTDSAKTRANL